MSLMLFFIQVLYTKAVLALDIANRYKSRLNALDIKNYEADKLYFLHGRVHNYFILQSIFRLYAFYV